MGLDYYGFFRNLKMKLAREASRFWKLENQVLFCAGFVPKLPRDFFIFSAFIFFIGFLFLSVIGVHLFAFY